MATAFFSGVTAESTEVWEWFIDRLTLSGLKIDATVRRLHLSSRGLTVCGVPQTAVISDRNGGLCKAIDAAGFGAKYGCAWHMAGNAIKAHGSTADRNRRLVPVDSEVQQKRIVAWCKAKTREAFQAEEGQVIAWYHRRLLETKHPPDAFSAEIRKVCEYVRREAEKQKCSFAFRGHKDLRTGTELTSNVVENWNAVTRTARAQPISVALQAMVDASYARFGKLQHKVQTAWKTAIEESARKARNAAVAGEAVLSGVQHAQAMMRNTLCPGKFADHRKDMLKLLESQPAADSVDVEPLNKPRLTALRLKLSSCAADLRNAYGSRREACQQRALQDAELELKEFVVSTNWTVTLSRDKVWRSAMTNSSKHTINLRNKDTGMCSCEQLKTGQRCIHLLQWLKSWPQFDCLVTPDDAYMMFDAANKAAAWAPTGANTACTDHFPAHIAPPPLCEVRHKPFQVVGRFKSAQEGGGGGVRSYRAASSKTVRCSQCNTQGHNKRKCPNPSARLDSKLTAQPAATAPKALRQMSSDAVAVVSGGLRVPEYVRALGTGLLKVAGGTAMGTALAGFMPSPTARTAANGRSTAGFMPSPTAYTATGGGSRRDAYPHHRGALPPEVWAERRAFNKALSGARLIVETSFGCLKGRFKCLREFRYPAWMAYRMSVVCAVLHNLSLFQEHDCIEEAELTWPMSLHACAGRERACGPHRCHLLPCRRRHQRPCDKLSWTTFELGLTSTTMTAVPNPIAKQTATQAATHTATQTRIRAQFTTT